MRSFLRFTRWFARVCLIVLVMVLIFAVGFFHEAADLGSVVALAFGLGTVLWVYRWPARDWAPNVRGENFYAVLGVWQRADLPTIRQAFRRLTQQYQPDRFPPADRAAAEAVFVRLNQAYEVLSDEEARWQYDGWIEELKGLIPPFDEAYERLRGESKHPMYQIYAEGELEGAASEGERLDDERPPPDDAEGPNH